MVDKSKVLLGFVDEPITDHYKEVIDFTTNKLGGHPVIKMLNIFLNIKNDSILLQLFF